jgi:hypothetical protein
MGFDMMLNVYTYLCQIMCDVFPGITQAIVKDAAAHASFLMMLIPMCFSVPKETDRKSHAPDGMTFPVWAYMQIREGLVIGCRYKKT